MTFVFSGGDIVEKESIHFKARFVLARYVLPTTAAICGPNGHNRRLPFGALV